MSLPNDIAAQLPASVLTKSQRKVFGPVKYTEGGRNYQIKATVRFDDECGNGHNTFSITGDVHLCDASHRPVRWDGGGCIHEKIAKHFPALAPLIKWHLVSTDGPMHYVANTVYHAEAHGPTHAYVYFTGPSDPLNLGSTRERLLGYLKADKAREAEGKEGYRVVWDEKTVKVSNLDHARSSAVWPEATDDELRQSKQDLTAALLARLPKLIAEFKAAVESLGFVY